MLLSLPRQRPGERGRPHAHRPAARRVAGEPAVLPRKLLELRRLFPIVVTLDDHEVENNYASLISQVDTEPDQDPKVFAKRRAAAYRGYHEFMPLRGASHPQGSGMPLYRELQHRPVGRLPRVTSARVAGIHAKGTPNPVVLTGDIHQHYAADLLLDFDDPASPIVGSELCGMSVTSGGDGSDAHENLTENPWIKYNGKRASL